MKPLILLIAAIVCASGAWAQSLWFDAYNGTANRQDVYNAVVTDAEGNVYAAGTTINPSSTSQTLVLLAKYSPTGQRLWVREWVGPVSGNHGAFAIALGPNNTVVVSGRSALDALVQRWDANGNLIWSTRFNGTASTGDDANAGVALGADGFIYAAGASTTQYLVASVPDNSLDVLVMKLNINGGIVWTRVFDGHRHVFGNDATPEIDRAVGLVMGPNSSPIVTGYSNLRRDNAAPPNTGYDFSTLRYDSNGNLQWISFFAAPGEADDRPQGISISADGTKVVSYGKSGSGNDQDIALVAYNAATGAELWNEVLGGDGAGPDIANGAVITNNGEVYFAGNAVMLATGTDGVVGKIDATGTNEWALTTGGAGNNERGTAIAFDPQGNLLATGWGDEGFGTTDDVLLLGFDPQGNVLREVYFNNPNQNLIDRGIAITVDAAGNAVVVGNSQSATGLDDALVVKFAAARSVRLQLNYGDWSGATPPTFQVEIEGAGGQTLGSVTGQPDAGGVLLLGAVPLNAQSVYITTPTGSFVANREAIAVTNGPNLVTVELANGDSDQNGAVDDADLTNLILDFGSGGGSSSGFATDFNGDGVVDDADLTILILNFGATADAP